MISVEGLKCKGSLGYIVFIKFCL
uniref:Uncharacterized protein n=1 Tax=Anguilla anguilla TaxID=7936 RepID=A0A0E9TPR3_ANGAN